MPRTYTSRGKKVKRQAIDCQYCGYGMKWQRGFLLPSHWECPNEACVSHELYSDYIADAYSDMPDFH